MALPGLHSPDDDWAEERVKRMMEPEQPIEPPKPGEKILAETSNSPQEPVSLVIAETDLSSDPSSDDGVDQLIDGNPEAKDEANTGEQPVGAEPPKAADAGQSLVVADPVTDEVVDEILKNDGDEALKAQDAAAADAVVMKPNWLERLKNDFSDFWDDKRKRYIALGIIGVLIIVIFSFPASRAFSLNLVGVRGNVSLRVLDGSTSQPLKNVSVSLAGQQAITDTQGNVKLSHVRLGSQTLKVQKTAFANYRQSIWVQTGTHSEPTVSLRAVGSQFSFVVTDYLTGKPVVAQVSSGQASAQADKNGKALLTVLATSGSKLKIQVAAPGYRTENLSLTPSSKAATKVSLVPVGKDVFVSNQSGKYDLYTADLDGKNRKVLLAATGNETSDLSLLVSPDNKKVAFVSTRDNQHDSQGYLLRTLSLVDVSTGVTQTLEHADAVTLVGWSGTKLVYGETVAGASAANPNRQKIISYDYSSSKKVQLAAANYFNGTELIGNAVYYAVSSTDPGTTASFNKINVDATGKQIIANQEIWTVLRTSYNTLALQANAGWLSYTVGAASTKPGTTPDSYNDVQYTDASDAAHSLWADNRDGKGVLLNHDTNTGKDGTITTQSGLSQPIRWISNTTIMYRVTTPQETADYVISTAGGQAKKVTDVTATSVSGQLH